MTDHCAHPKCGKELTHIPGRRKKKYCNPTCKLRHWQELNPVKKEKKKASGGVKLPNDFLEAKSIGILKEDGTIEKVFKWKGDKIILDELSDFAFKAVQDLSKPNTEVKPVEQPQTNYVIDTQKISELEKELAAIPDKTKGLGKLMAKSLQDRIYKLKHS